MRIGFGGGVGSGGAGGGDDGREEVPPDVYEAVICCIESVGQHEERNQPGVTKPKIVIGLEVDWRNSKGRRPSLFKKVNANLWANADGTKKSDLRAMLDVVRPGKVGEAFAAKTDVETSEWVGKTVRVTVEHDGRGRAQVKGFLKSKLQDNGMKIENDWSEPFGLWKWLLEHAVSR